MGAIAQIASWGASAWHVRTPRISRKALARRNAQPKRFPLALVAVAAPAENAWLFVAPALMEAHAMNAKTPCTFMVAVVWSHAQLDSMEAARGKKGSYAKRAGKIAPNAMASDAHNAQAQCSSRMEVVLNSAQLENMARGALARSALPLAPSVPVRTYAQSVERRIISLRRSVACRVARTSTLAKEKARLAALVKDARATAVNARTKTHVWSAPARRTSAKAVALRGVVHPETSWWVLAKPGALANLAR